MSSYYNFKKVQVVPNGTEFLDIVLSKINRKVSFCVSEAGNLALRPAYFAAIKGTFNRLSRPLSYASTTVLQGQYLTLSLDSNYYSS